MNERRRTSTSCWRCSTRTRGPRPRAGVAERNDRVGLGLLSDHPKRIRSRGEPVALSEPCRPGRGCRTAGPRDEDPLARVLARRHQPARSRGDRPDAVHRPRQVTDAYLLALAVRHGGRFATFDRSPVLRPRSANSAPRRCDPTARRGADGHAQHRIDLARPLAASARRRGADAVDRSRPGAGSWCPTCERASPRHRRWERATDTAVTTGALRQSRRAERVSSSSSAIPEWASCCRRSLPGEIGCRRSSSSTCCCPLVPESQSVGTAPCVVATLPVTDGLSTVVAVVGPASARRDDP